eukprot:747291-Pelagomonas_calceolata.AAC.1
MGRQAYKRKGIKISSKPGEASALNFLRWDPTNTTKIAVLGSRPFQEPTQIQHLVSRAPLGASCFYLEAQPYLTS